MASCPVEALDPLEAMDQGPMFNELVNQKLRNMIMPWRAPSPSQIRMGLPLASILHAFRT